MVNFELFLFGLLITSTITGLATEAVKTVLTEHNKAYKANTLAGLVSIVVSALMGTGYVVLYDVEVSAQIIVYVVALIVMSWLCSMLGYDKVIQTIGQLKTSDK